MRGMTSHCLAGGWIERTARQVRQAAELTNRRKGAVEFSYLNKVFPIPPTGRQVSQAQHARAKQYQAGRPGTGGSDGGSTATAAHSSVLLGLIKKKSLGFLSGNPAF